MNVPIKDLETAVSSLNDDFEQCTEETGTFLRPFVMHTDGSNQWVTFLDSNVIWEADNEEREFDEAADEHEELTPFLRRRAEEYIAILGRFVPERNRPLTDREKAMIDDAWTLMTHVAAGPPCLLPPRGWKCTRGAGHEGPCAAVVDDAP